MTRFFCSKIKGKDQEALDALAELLETEAADRIKNPSTSEKKANSDNAGKLSSDITLFIDNNCTGIANVAVQVYDREGCEIPLNSLDNTALCNVLAKDYNTWSKAIMKYLCGGVAIMGTMSSYLTWAITSKQSPNSVTKPDGTTTLIVGGISLVATGLAYILPRCIGKYCSDKQEAIKLKLTPEQLQAFYAECVALELSNLKHKPMDVINLISKLLSKRKIDEDQSIFLQRHYGITETTPLLGNRSPVLRGAANAV